MSEPNADANGKPAPKPADGGGAGNGGGERMIPYAKFQAAVADKKALQERVTTLETEVQTAAERAATADTLAEQLRKVKDEHKAAASSWGEERALLAAGVVDAEDIDLVRFHHGRLPAEGRPTVADFVAGLKAEGAVVPKGLGHLFTPADKGGAGDGDKGAAAGAAGQRKPMPKVSGTDGRQPVASEALPVDQIKKLRETAQRTKDPKDWAKWQAAIDAASATIAR